MMRVILWLLFLTVVWRMFRRAATGSPTRPPEQQPPRKAAYPFADVEEADFEDLSGKEPHP